MDFVDRANRTPLKPQLMKDMMDHIDQMSDEQRSDMTGRNLGLIQFLDAHRIASEANEKAMILMSFEFRMEALVRLRDHAQHRAWTLKYGKDLNDPDLIHKVLVEVAAGAPLYLVNDHPEFEAEEFFRLALKRAEASGEA